MKLRCDHCGELGLYAGPYCAYEKHSRLGAAAAVMNEVVVRREAVGHSLKYRL